jgi:hypothetical protein
MISKQHRFIFVHVGRTGGSSFERIAGVEVTSNEKTKHFGNTDFDEKHESFEYYKIKYPDEFNAFFKFTIVRNPFDRLVSRWLWRTNVVKNIGEMDFKDFILQTNYGQYSKKFKLSEFSIQESIKKFDYIGRYENIDLTYNYLCEKLNLSNVNIPHANKTNHERYQEYYTEESIQIVREMYKDDLELFGYDFEI